MLSIAAMLIPAAAALRVAVPVPRASISMTSAGGDLSKFTVVQLKEKLRAAGLPVSGRKAELIERLGGLNQASEPVPVPVSSSAFPEIQIEACKS